MFPPIYFYHKKRNVNTNKNINFFCKKEPPLNMTVSNVTDDGTIHVLEGTQITLSCYVGSGVPEELMTWISNDILLNNGGPGYLEYIFIPKRIDHMRYFTCSASNDNTHEPLSQRVQLEVVCKYITTNVPCPGFSKFSLENKKVEKNLACFDKKMYSKLNVCI